MELIIFNRLNQAQFLSIVIIKKTQKEVNSNTQKCSIGCSCLLFSYFVYFFQGIIKMYRSIKLFLDFYFHRPFHRTYARSVLG